MLYRLNIFLGGLLPSKFILRIFRIENKVRSSLSVYFSSLRTATKGLRIGHIIRCIFLAASAFQMLFPL